MGKKITVILRDGTELTYENARVVEGNKTWIYQVNKNQHPEDQQTCNDLSLCCIPHASEHLQSLTGFLLSLLR
jgi:hypothetical protein